MERTEIERKYKLIVHADELHHLSNLMSSYKTMVITIQTEVFTIKIDSEESSEERDEYYGDQTHNIEMAESSLFITRLRKAYGRQIEKFVKEYTS